MTNLCTNNSSLEQLLAKNLKIRRTLKGISQYKLSEMTGFPQSMIAKIENCQRKLQASELSVFAKCLGVRVEDFFNDNIQLENTSNY